VVFTYVGGALAGSAKSPTDYTAGVPAAALRKPRRSSAPYCGKLLSRQALLLHAASDQDPTCQPRGGSCKDAAVAAAAVRGRSVSDARAGLALF